MSGTILEAMDAVVNKIHKPCPHEVHYILI